jgi:hypothetical protein
VVDAELDEGDGPVAEPLEMAVIDVEVVHPLVDEAALVGQEVLRERVVLLGQLARGGVSREAVLARLIGRMITKVGHGG